MRWDREEAQLKLKKMGCRLRLIHLHSGNSSKNQRHGKPYVTLANILDAKGDLVYQATATCSKRDNPSRSLGRTIATDRALHAVLNRAAI